MTHTPDCSGHCRWDSATFCRRRSVPIQSILSVCLLVCLSSLSLSVSPSLCLSVPFYLSITESAEALNSKSNASYFGSRPWSRNCFIPRPPKDPQSRSLYRGSYKVPLSAIGSQIRGSYLIPRRWQPFFHLAPGTSCRNQSLVRPEGQSLRVHMESFRKLWVPYFGVLIKRILLII